MRLRPMARLPSPAALPTLRAQSNNPAGRNIVTTRLLSRRHVLTGAAALTTAAIVPRASLGAGDWRPTETVKLIVPAAAGGTTGAAEVVRAKADGHTILVGNPGPNAIAFRIYKNLTYKPEQLQPVSNMIRIPNIMSAHPSTGIKSISELIAALKADPDKFNY